MLYRITGYQTEKASQEQVSDKAAAGITALTKLIQIVGKDSGTKVKQMLLELPQVISFQRHSVVLRVLMPEASGAYSLNATEQLTLHRSSARQPETRSLRLTAQLVHIR